MVVVLPRHVIVLARVVEVADVVVAFVFSLGQALPQQLDLLNPPAGCRYECRLTYSTVTREVTEDHCEHETK